MPEPGRKYSQDSMDSDGGGSPTRRTCLAPWVDNSVERATALSAQRLTRLRGLDIIRDPYLNKGTAFTERERDLLGLRGLLPPVQFTIEQQLARQKISFEKSPNSMTKYIFLERLHNRNETVYYRFLLENIMDTMPIVYTPTVGQACLEFSDMYRSRVRGLYLSRKDQDSFKDICRNWPQHDIDIIVVTDGSRILGLGDLGVNGMGIPIGKLALYVAAAGFMPWRTLPITVDMGTNNEALKKSPGYIGIHDERPGDDEFYTVMDKFVEAFEDFSNEHAFGLLDKYRNQVLSFNDDIQGTAAVVLAGLLAALRIQRADGVKATLREQRIVFLGAGSAGVGVADLIATGMLLEARAAGDTTTTIEQFRKTNFWLVDSKGTVTTTREDKNKMQAHKVPFARDGEPSVSLEVAIKEKKPTVLIGLAGLPGGAFTEDMIKGMHKDCTGGGTRPVVMALSNPTSKAECTAEQAYTWTNGDCIFSSGSPFDPVELNGKTYVTGQGNNMYIFPGVGYGAVRCGATKITDSMFYEAARSLSLQVSKENLASGSIYPNLNDIRQITAKVARGVCEVAEREGIATVERPKDGWFEKLKSEMWWPHYEDYV